VKRLWLLMLSIVVVAAPRLAAGEMLRETSEKFVESAGIGGIRVENSRGQVDIRPSADGRIHLIAIKEVDAWSESGKRHLADETLVTTATESGVFTVRVSYSGSNSIHINIWDAFHGQELPHCAVKLTLEVPARLPVVIQTSSGDVSTAGLMGMQSITTRSGDLQVRNSGGFADISTSSGDITGSAMSAARIRTSSGDLRLDDARGPLDIHTHSGDVVIKGAADSVSVSTGSGDVQVGDARRGVRAQTTSGGVTVRDASGTISISTSSGDIEARLREPLSAVDMSSASGEIRTRFDRDASLHFDVRTTSGSVEADLPLKVYSAGRHQLDAVSGAGQAPVVLRSSSGDIHVMSGGQ
jgi:DUF4097 and DUF4098 domain-containing protein YvlB